jgi:Iap family predicted aminopeptidase
VLPRGAIYSEQAHCFSLFSVETPKAIGSAEASELTQELAYGAATSSWTLVDWTVEEEVSPDTVTISWTWG